jgi:hypothetical protein
MIPITPNARKIRNVCDSSEFPHPEKIENAFLDEDRCNMLLLLHFG